VSYAIAKVCAAISADDAVVRLDTDEMHEVIDALDERERSIGRERARAEAAEADAAGLRAEHAELIECLLADRNALRAIVEGRTIAPSDAEIEAHAAAGGWWLLHSLGSHPGASSLAALALDAEQAQRAARVQRDRGEGAHRWHAMLDGRPCPWPVAP